MKMALCLYFTFRITEVMVVCYSMEMVHVLFCIIPIAIVSILLFYGIKLSIEAVQMHLIYGDLLSLQRLRSIKVN
jgi:hypothetical protein